ncbi:MAG TPA: LysM peptidoglycan-binding domain-containing protein [Polyangiaceae bacterium]|nr:LysM peptidoglycan-binding domain-containing protein [Polyangiaceae bacterium]
MVRGLLAALIASATLAQAPRVSAEPGAETESGPQLNSGVRRVDADAARVEPASGSAVSEAPPPPRSHRSGPAPREPRSTLPEGVPRGEPDARARRRVALGHTSEERQLASSDPELQALAEAEKTLFESNLHGLEPGWSWLPDETAHPGVTEVSASGLPPAPPLQPLEPGSQELAVDAEWLRSLAMPDLPVRMDERVVKYLKFYRDSEKGRAIAHVWAKKAGRFAPALRAEFVKAGLPKDLIWLSLIESGHNPTIKSPAGALGLWQFIPASAKMYGLTVDRWVDERLDPLRSTQAAIRFLSDLHQRFGSWELAIGAYNMGYGGMSRAIQKYNTNDFWQLARYEAGIPWETTLYVPKILAIAIVMNNKKAFGIDHVVPDPPERFDTLLVKPGHSLQDVARAARVSSAELEQLNPQILAGRTPPVAAGTESNIARSWPVRLPAGSGVETRARLSALASEEHGAYRTRFGDTLESIAEEHAIGVDALAALNGLEKSEHLRTGTILLLPARARAVEPNGRRVVVVPEGTFLYRERRRVFYEVRPGDALAAIASAFGVQQTELSGWNALDAGARLHGGMILQLFVERDRSLDDVRYLTEEQAVVLVAGTPAFYDHFEALNGRVRLVVVCKEGDTLAALGSRYGMSVGSMERVNRRSRNDVLLPGEKIVVYTERPGATGVDRTDAAPVALGKVTAPHPEVLPGRATGGPSGGSTPSLPARATTLD